MNTPSPVPGHIILTETSASRPGVVAIGIAAVLLIVMYLIARKKGT